MTIRLELGDRVAVVSAARFHPGTASRDGTLRLGAGPSAARRNPRVEVLMAQADATDFVEGLSLLRPHDLTLIDDDHWVGSRIEARGFRYAGTSQPDAYSGRVQVSFLGETRPG